MKKIALSIYKKNPKYKGMFALVDDEDYERLSKFYWSAVKKREGLFYAERVTKRDKNRKQKVIGMHIEVMGSKWIDHIDFDGLNNQKSNLREVTHSQNMMNKAKKRGSASGLKGVSWHNKNNNWLAKIKINGKDKHLGCSKDPIKCARLYDEAAIKYFGEYAKINGV